MMRKKNHNKFSKKKHSKRGMLACVLAAASIFVLLYLIFEAFMRKGNGSVYFGSTGILALAVAVAALAQAVKSLREEDVFRSIPIASTLLSVLATGAWLALYALGFVL